MGSREVAAAPVDTGGFTMADILTKPVRTPNRYVIYGPEGCGKTSFAAQAPSPIFLQSRGETGLGALIDSGLIPEVAHTPEITRWPSLIGVVRMLTTEKHNYKTVVLDTINSGERLCHEYVCETQFGGNWSKEKGGFNNFGNGVDASMGEWRMLLSALDDLRLSRDVTVILLGHTRIKAYRNPLGADYDRFRPNLADPTWEFTKQWADAVLFLNYEDFVTEDKGNVLARGKAKGGQRMLHTERSPAWDAKNRFNLAPEIECGNSAAESWKNFLAAIQEGRKKAN